MTDNPRTMRVRISEPGLMTNLVESLQRGDCLSAPVAEDECQVVHPFALDELEARVELMFFLRAWAISYPDVRVELVG